MSEDVKVVSVTGVAAQSMGGYEGERKKRVRATTRKRKGGAEEGPVIQVDTAQSMPPMPPMAPMPPMPPMPPMNINKVMPPVNKGMLKPAPAPVPAVELVAAENPSEQVAGSRSIRVELKKRTTAKKVHLHPKKAEQPKDKKDKTRKARKVLLGVSAQHKQMTRAKKMHRAVKAMPLATLREQLVKKGLIKATSKAPESVLRQMAADAQIVAEKAL